MVRQARRPSYGSGQRGVALVLTLIMLAVITVVTVVFLATTRRNRQSTIVRQDQTSAENGAETGQQHAIAKIAERILAETNLLAFDFLVSRPLSYGLETNNGMVVPFNNDVIPRVHNPSNTVNVFLDLDRNRLFSDPGGASRPYGDPIWLGVLDKPWFGHSRTNQFKARYAYLILPVGKALDLNTIHNDTSPNGGYGFMRNQGFGPWELNLAALFRELAPEVWDYDYFKFAGRPVGVSNAFADARSIVNFRHGWPGTPPDAPGLVADALNFTQVYPDSFLNNFPLGAFDLYSDGSGGFPIGRDISQLDDDFPLKLARWPGADTTNHFFHIQEFFDHADLGGANGRSNKVTFEFYSNLTNALARTNHGPTFYKLINLLATQTGSDVRDKINLNFADEHARLPGTNYSATNFVAWDSSPELSVVFFTNVAQRIFLAQSNEFNPGTNEVPMRAITEIPIAPTNRYSAAVHRILQEAANIFDAANTNLYPSVFRPLFGPGPLAGVTYITGWTNDNFTGPEFSKWQVDNTNSIPAVIGAKKGFPNFNEFTLRTTFLVTRKLQVKRDRAIAVGVWPSETNQMYVLGISNSFQIEAWNSYTRPYPRTVNLSVGNVATMLLTNSLGFQASNTFFVGTNMQVAAGTWPGRGMPALINSNSFILPLRGTNESQILLSNGIYRFANPANTFANISTNDFESGSTYPLAAGFPVPDWQFTLSNHITYLMSENTPQGVRIVDFVLLNDSVPVDLNRDLVSAIDQYAGITGILAAVANVWNTNRPAYNAPTEGIEQQMSISLGNTEVSDNEWKYVSFNGSTAQARAAAIDRFRYFCGLSPFSNGPLSTNWSIPMQAGFNPAAKIAVVSTWQANDPLVHYHVEDLRYPLSNQDTNHQYYKPSDPVNNTDPGTLGRLNKRYSPWGGNTEKDEASYNGNIYNVWLRDPGMFSSDDWQFPSNKLAGVGLLGRVHRGTPWQTIYFKAAVTNANTWLLERPTYLSHPSNDWKLPDMFTTALDERTSTGLMSINQTNMEAWSAALSGVLVLSNNLARPFVSVTRDYDEVFIQPWGNLAYTNSGFAQIWNAIFNYQTDTNRGRPLQSIGEFLQSVPELTTKSPFLNLVDDDQLRYGLDDFAYEQIPQQILSLLRVGQARFVIYAYGQALKPERIDPATGTVVNYQVTAEYATRTVIRLEGDPRSRIRAVVESFNILPPD